MNIEILAPAGGDDQLDAAIKAGADAVYLGTENFNARRNAHNFGDLSETVSRCHSFGIKVYVVLNTLIKNREIGEFAKTVRMVAQSGADAVIVQDLGGIDIIKSICPDLPLHASTQMTVHNLSGIKALEKLGFSRAVLSRELSAKEIRYITQNTEMEIEVFVHGALCVSVSGQCYLSSMLGGRSGNRGLCAQPCRLNFNNGERDYALSLKDMTLYNDIGELADIGVKSLKIEGRMKRPEYVYAAVSECRKVLNGNAPDIKMLENVFSRSGFTNGYFTGNITPQMFGRRTQDDVNAMQNSLLSINRKMSDAYFEKKAPISVNAKPVFEFNPVSASNSEKKGKIRIRAEKAEQISTEMYKNAEKIIIPQKEIMKNKSLIAKYSDKLICELPLMYYKSDSKLKELLGEIKSLGITNVSVGNIGMLFEAKNAGLTVHSDYSMNVINKYSTESVKQMGAVDCTMSFESNAKDIKGTLPTGIIAYGHLPLMTYRSCPAKKKSGCKSCNKTPKIKDRSGKTFTVICRGEYSQLLNSIPLYLADRMNEINADFYTLYFTTEAPSKCEEIYRDYLIGARANGEMTRGLYFKELH